MESISPRTQILEPGTTYYRPYRGEFKGLWQRTMTIMRTDFISRIKNKWIIVLEVLAWFFGIIPSLFMLYFITLAEGDFGAGMFISYFSSISIWVILVTTVAGSRLISDDLANNSFTLYLSRPIAKENYFIGKFGSIFLIVSTLSILPSIIMASMVVGLSTGGTDPGYNVGAVVLTFIAVGFLVALVLSSIAMAFSSITKNYLYAGVGIFCSMLFSTIIPNILSALTDNHEVMYISIWNNIIFIADDWGGFNTQPQDWLPSILVLALITLICNLIVWYKLSKSELAE
jgi:ABC-type transport system involved in multi-copper enzyme maturation permease subunit